MDKKPVHYPSRISLTLRLFGGGYLVYLAWDLMRSVPDYTGSMKALLIAAIVVFGIVGAIFFGVSAKALYKNEYAEAQPIEFDDDDEEIEEEDKTN